jgi:hypothetical protein
MKRKLIAIALVFLAFISGPAAQSATSLTAGAPAK